MLKNLLKSVLGSATVKQPPARAEASENVLRNQERHFTYAADGLWTIHNASFLEDKRFQESYWLGADSGHRICAPEDLHIEWRVYTCCWAAEHSLRLAGDFVECGVSTGIVSRAVTNYIRFEKYQRNFWLIDTFDGIPLNQAQPEELALANSKNSRHYYDCHADVERYFSKYKNAHVVKGEVPDVLTKLDISEVAYLHIDMNIAEPEFAAATHFWDKLVLGAVVVFDDYGSLAHVQQKIALDTFARERGVSIMTLPTGQGLLIKS